MKVVFLVFVLAIQGITYGQGFTLVFFNKKVDKEELPADQVKKIMDGHMANLNRLATEGKLWAAGPFDGGGGIFIFKSNSAEEVNEWLAADPGIQAKRWDIEVFPYGPRVGAVCSVGKDYEMTHYYFVRYSIQKTGQSNDTMSAVLHQTYIKQWIGAGSVIAEGSLGETEGSILVLKEEPASEKLANDPAVKSGALTMDLKKLFIAKGSFCEPKH